MSDTPRYMTPEAMAAFREAQERAGTLPELRNAPTADLSGFFGMLPGGQLSGPILTELQRKYLPLGVTETGNPDFYGPIANAVSYVPGIDPRNRAIRAQRMADELRSLDEIAIGAEDFTGALSNIGRGAGGFRDYVTAALSVLPFDGVGRAIGRRVLGVPVVGEGLQRIGRWLSHFDPLADNAEDVLEAAFREGATADEIMQLSQEVGTPAEWGSVVNAVAAREAGARYEPGAVVNRQQPDFAVRAEQPAVDPRNMTRDEWLQTLSVGRLRDTPAAPVSARGVHYSRAEGLQRTDPSFYGTGHIGEERRMVRREGLPNRTYFYAEGADGTPIRPEEPVAQRAPYVYEADLQGLYDVNADPEGLVALANRYNPEGTAIPDLERLIQQYGYSGYISDYAPSWAPQSRRAAAMFEPVDVRRAP